MIESSKQRTNQVKLIKICVYYSTSLLFHGTQPVISNIKQNNKTYLISVCVCVRMCFCVCIWSCVSLWLHLSACHLVCMHESLGMSVYLSVCLTLFLYICLCMHLCVCACLCICVCNHMLLSINIINKQWMLALTNWLLLVFKHFFSNKHVRSLH